MNNLNKTVMPKFDKDKQDADNVAALLEPVVGDQWNERVYIPILVVVGRFRKYVITYDVRDGLEVRTLKEFQDYLCFRELKPWADVTRGNPLAEKLAHSRVELVRFSVKRRMQKFVEGMVARFRLNGEFRFLKHQFTIKRLP